MAEDKKGGEKTIEMRLAELEDKVSKIHITEEELKAFHKVSALMGGGAPMAAEGSHVQAMTPALSPQLCSIARRVVTPRSIINPCIIVPPRICYECICGPCNCEVGGGGFGGGFGGFGM